jgi:prepilin peptidase CpaA
MGTPPLVALGLGLAALPVCVWAAWVDLSRMKIPNNSVLALAGVFLVLGLALVLLTDWTFGDWAWRWTHLVVVLLVGMALNAASLIGAGDAKLAAAAAPFVALSDWRTLLWLYPLTLLVCWLLHRIARATVGPRLAPDWLSWSSGKRFPMGVAIGATLLAYLAICAAA